MHKIKLVHIVWFGILLLVVVVGILAASYSTITTLSPVNQIATVRAFLSSECQLHACHHNDQRIPRVIYRTAPDSWNLGPGNAAWDFTARHNPEYTQVVLDDAQSDQFMQTAVNGSVYETYCNLVPGAAKADLLRYCVLYERGGVYLDAKSGAGPLCTLIRPDDDMLVSTWTHLLSDMSDRRASYGELEQWWLAASPRHPAMRHVIDAIVHEVDVRMGRGERWYANRREEVLTVTGPLMFTQHVDIGRSDVRLVCADGNGIMVYDVLGSHPSGQSYGGSGYLFRK